MQYSRIIINLTVENTKIETKSAVFNIEVIVPLAHLWDQIIKNNRIYVQTNLSIPVIVTNEKKINLITLNDYYSVNTIDSDKKVVSQLGYYEGVIEANPQINAKTWIWLYDLSKS